MKQIDYTPVGVCSRHISFELDDNNCIHNLVFSYGCNGNLKAIAKLCEGKNALEVASILQGNTCGSKPTSCADQLSKAIISAIH